MSTFSFTAVALNAYYPYPNHESLRMSTSHEGSYVRVCVCKSCPLFVQGSMPWWVPLYPLHAMFIIYIFICRNELFIEPFHDPNTEDVFGVLLFLFCSPSSWFSPFVSFRHVNRRTMAFTTRVWMCAHTYTHTSPAEQCRVMQPIIRSSGRETRRQRQSPAILSGELSGSPRRAVRAAKGGGKNSRQDRKSWVVDGFPHATPFPSRAERVCGSEKISSLLIV